MAQTSGTIGLQQVNDNTPTNVKFSGASAETAVQGTLAKPSIVTFGDVEATRVEGKNMELYNDRKRGAYLNNQLYYAIDMWRTHGKDGGILKEFTDKQVVDVNITVPAGKVLNITKINAQLLTNGQDYNWKVAVIDKLGKELKATEPKISKKKDTTTPSISEDVSSETKLKGLTGTVVLRIYVSPADGKSNYFAIPYLTVDAELQDDERTSYTITTSCNIAGAGKIGPAEGAVNVPEGDSQVISVVANTGYTFKSWLIDDKETVYTSSYTFKNVTENHIAEAQFEKNPVLSFAKPEGVYCVSRMFPKGVNTVAKGGKATLPAANYMYYKEGYTMTGWSVGGTDYGFGKEVTLNEDVTAEPVFAKNTVSLAARSAEVTVTYDFNTSTNGGRLVNIENNADKVITRITVDGQEIDYVMDADCQKDAGITDFTGKLNNTAKGVTAQCNKGTVLTIHDAVKGSVITLTCNSKFTTATTFNGAAGTLDGSKAIYTATEDGDVKVIVKDESIYLTTITVTYPYVPKSYTLTTEDGDFYTLYLDYAVTVPENITVYTGALNGSTLTLNAVNDGYIKAGNAVIVKGTGAGIYTFTEKKDAEAGTYEGNALKGVTVETAVADLAPAGTVLTLGTDSKGIVGFRKPNNDKVSANKAYLDYVASAGAPAFVNILLPGEATGIQGIQSVQQKSADSAIYNMMGQRVGANAKGLILMNGKKVIRK